MNIFYLSVVRELFLGLCFGLYSRLHMCLQSEEARIAREVEAHEKRIRKELEKQDMLQRKVSPHIHRKMFCLRVGMDVLFTCNHFILLIHKTIHECYAHMVLIYKMSRFCIQYKHPIN